MNNTLNDLLIDWHHWSKRWTPHAEPTTGAMWRGVKSSRQWDDTLDIADQAQHNATMQAIEFAVSEMAPTFRTALQINARNLDYFDAIFFLGSGEGTLTDQQKADLLAFVHDDGKGFIGGHASTVAFYNWPEYGEMIGGFMDGEFPVQPMSLIVEDPEFPGARDFPTTFTDQFQFLKAPYDTGDVHTILRLDPTRLTPEQLARRPGGDFPVVWARTYGRGRVYISTFGHLDDPWDQPAVRELYLEGIKWALGLTDADVTPDTQSQ